MYLYSSGLSFFGFLELFGFLEFEFLGFVFAFATAPPSNFRTGYLESMTFVIFYC